VPQETLPGALFTLETVHCSQQLSSILMISLPASKTVFTAKQVCRFSIVLLLTDKSMVTKKVDGIKESSDSSAVIEDEDGQGNC